MPRDDDPRIADLARYRRARERARKAPPAPPRGSQPILGSRPRAGLILVVAILVIAALWLAPNFL